MNRDKKTGRFIKQSKCTFPRNAKGQFVKRTSKPTTEEIEAFWEER